MKTLLSSLKESNVLHWPVHAYDGKKLYFWSKKDMIKRIHMGFAPPSFSSRKTEISGTDLISAQDFCFKFCRNAGQATTMAIYGSYII